MSSSEQTVLSLGCAEQLTSPLAHVKALAGCLGASLIRQVHLNPFLHPLQFKVSWQPPSFTSNIFTSKKLQQVPLGHELSDDVYWVPDRGDGVQREDVLMSQLLHGLNLVLECTLVGQVR